jgi:hypothetical protein
MLGDFPKTLAAIADGALRWVSTAGFASTPTTFFDNAVYLPLALG